MTSKTMRDKYITLVSISALVSSMMGLPQQSACSSEESEKTSDTSTAAFDKGCKLLKSSDALKAIGQFDLALKASPKNSMAYCKRGECNAFLERKERALQDYNKAIELDPKNA